MLGVGAIRLIKNHVDKVHKVKEFVSNRDVVISQLSASGLEQSNWKVESNNAIGLVTQLSNSDLHKNMKSLGNACTALSLFMDVHSYVDADSRLNSLKEELDFFKNFNLKEIEKKIKKYKFLLNIVNGAFREIHSQITLPNAEGKLLPMIQKLESSIDVPHIEIRAVY